MRDASPNSGDAKVAELRQEVEQTRAELGETVAALAAKRTRRRRRTSWPGTARELRTRPAVPARRAADRVRTSVRDNPKPWLATDAAMVAFVLLVLRRRRVAQANRLGAFRKES